MKQDAEEALARAKQEEEAEYFLVKVEVNLKIEGKQIRCPAHDWP